ncbi:AraC family transcriptional regulator [Spirillospora sp. NPDC029432]|uniref:AraC family transcriptional regulator n=1 Tax=Spirillospora sp. NPDC029432 TaxID=3154599 RepID=UPI003452D8FA
MPEGTYAVEVASTDEIPARERADFWSEHITGYHCSLDYRFPRGGDYRGRTARQRTAAYQFVESRSDRIGYARTVLQARRDPDEDYRLLVPLEGGVTMRQGGQELRARPGTGCLITPAEPFELVQDGPVRSFILTLPAGRVLGRLGRAAPRCATLDMTTGLGRVVHGMLGSLYEERDALTAREFDAVCDRVAELVCMVVSADDRPGAPGHLAEVEAMVRRFVRANAADPELNGAAVARRLGWSLRQVQLALQHAGTTPRELIKEERLLLVRDRLTSPRYAHLTITEVAHLSGFSSASALSTAFRRRFGLAPRDLRHGTAH